MTRDENMPWEWLLLGILDESGGETTLQNIYASIEKKSREIEEDDIKLINPRLLVEIDPKFGNRPIYQHTVRGCISSYIKRGLVERIGRGIYRLTDMGLKRLREY